MVTHQLASRGISDDRVLAAMRAVDRSAFVPDRYRDEAYLDGPLPIGHRQTISQPYIVAYMTEFLTLSPGTRVLEVGTGSGYQTAILAELQAEVFSVEIIAALAASARSALAATGYLDRVSLRCGDGSMGWEEHAPFERILVAAAPATVPTALKEQLCIGGTMVLPVGDGNRQDLVSVTRTGVACWTTRYLLPVLFVPMTGQAELGRAPTR
jgi:protein-L-isoaspartate(D-aspartate) O-methyltransferase